MQVVTDHKGYFDENIEPAMRGSKLKVIDYNRPGSAGEGEFVGTNFERKYRREGRPFYAIAGTKSGREGATRRSGRLVGNSTPSRERRGRPGTMPGLPP